MNAQNLADMFKALSNPNRLNIFMQLLSCCEPGSVCNTDEVIQYSVGDLGENLDIAPSTLSHHIKELQRAGLIQTRRRGQHVDCWVDRNKLDELEYFFSLEQN